MSDIAEQPVNIWCRFNSITNAFMYYLLHSRDFSFKPSSFGCFRCGNGCHRIDSQVPRTPTISAPCSKLPRAKSIEPLLTHIKRIFNTTTCKNKHASV